MIHDLVEKPCHELTHFLFTLFQILSQCISDLLSLYALCFHRTRSRLVMREGTGSNPICSKMRTCPPLPPTPFLGCTGGLPHITDAGMCSNFEQPSSGIVNGAFAFSFFRVPSVNELHYVFASVSTARICVSASLPDNCESAFLEDPV